MKALMRRGVRLAVMTLGFAALIVGVNAVPAAATPATPGFASKELGRGTYQSNGSLRFEKGLDVVVSKITMTPGANSGWHSHPGARSVSSSRARSPLSARAGATAATPFTRRGSPSSSAPVRW
jgi:hypothetical protein